MRNDASATEHPITAVESAAYTIPTDKPESDGTFEWSSTTIIIAEVTASGMTGIGYTYSSPATAVVIREHLASVLTSCDAMTISTGWDRMVHAVRNIGRPGIAAAAISAVDNAMWDLKSKLLDLPLIGLLRAVRTDVPVYGSGGFTSYSVAELRAQLRGWVEEGISRVKMKVGRDPTADVARVREARAAIGDQAELFVDANAAYDVDLAAAQARIFAESGVSWFEEPVSSDDLVGLRSLRARIPAGMEIAAGEYGYDLGYFRRMLDAESVDVLQADASRCCGISEFLRVGTLCESRGIPLSAHTAPALHLHPSCAMPSLRHIEYFHDHVRIERLFFDGVVAPRDGSLAPDMTRPGLGLALKLGDIERFRSL
ncbi:MAG TPA: enolase C-terminal domain-like protein [Gemmatimonadaceae bacterium]|nr:enolase C-terminal domain-like protein [Gemmatimonadaceae bacterium]